ncbi:GntR family transcriptional regulator [Bifidobacterium sp. SMB2]|uniref:GntR family transcriptional regulator n=1 Tax=Bifidobacterium saimiriisciurei TaxID=2661627 RepID=A0ABX0C9V9_9BIFI|nr:MULTISPECIES: GntR family transcriptional regulator [Bifidobacterium]NEG96337.1 GntR family transcriptional regulator [Bifidobacterium sp. SMB2]NEH11031.1 GntR family transcriptional regulator [Bifidobacterium saimiriisciurei]
MTRSKKDIAYEYLRQRIISCELKPGDYLDEQEVAQSLGISRTPVREAVNRLAEEKLLQLMPRKGVVVSQLSVKDAFDMLETRQMVEPEILRKAFPNLDRESVIRYRDYVVSKIESKDATTEEVSRDFDFELHMYFAERTGNSCLVDIMKMLMTQNQRVRAVMASIRSERVRDACREHLAILDAILAGDEEKAVEAMRLHQDNAIEDFRHHYRTRQAFFM